jgi:hypothetical protein
MLKLFLLILSHKKSTYRQFQNLYISQNNEIISYYFIGDENIESEYKIDGNIVYLKVPDNYESLSLKTYYAIKFVYDNFHDKIFGIFKTDDDIELDLINLKKIVDDNLNLKYFGIVNKIESDTLSNYHFNKCESEILNRTEQIIPKCEYCSGGGYYLNKSILELILKEKDIFYNILFEDVSVGYSLSKNNIYPNHLPIKKAAFWKNYVSIRWNLKHCDCGRIKENSELFCRDCGKKR